MVSTRLLRKTVASLVCCTFLLWSLYCVLTSGLSDPVSGSLHARNDPEIESKDSRAGGGGGSRHVQELKADYEEAEYSSSVQEKADVDAILEKPWTFNKSAAEASRKDMFTFFNPYKIITMTSDDAIGGQLQRFYHSKAIPIVDVPPGIRRLLPRKQLFRDVKYQTCAVVGNGGILLNSSCGNSIDANEFVIRCNFAEMKGFARDVGIKTDVLTFNPSILDRKFNKLNSNLMRTKFLERLHSYGKYVLWLPIFSPHVLPISIRTALTFYERNSGKLKDVQLAFPGNVLPEILDFWMSKGVDEERISTGLLMYIIASTICDKIQLYGFYPFPEYQDKPIPYHYEDKLNKNITNSEFTSNFRRFHRLPDEFVYLKKMHTSGALQLHIGECLG
ncbi:alpha-N-acetylneuraminate alpha-2,8-sialyltransferase ST8SIA3-like isoform X2 [Apostichopus japonicus]|uniref:alpha-N-acetylneuraminate alpha-2,8-sialyltransferase ST8SIA3-like isoform X2 n=1 Tax=Stichopus japonicus TaxID=307972 RepID=UPI003AB2CDBE